METSAVLAAATLSDPRWPLLVARDAGADGRFVYSVATTGVYCRPSCSVRLARPQHIRFHDSCAEAEAAGFRPCKRCRPAGQSPRDRNAAVVEAACRQIDAAITAAAAPPGLEELAAGAGMSPTQFGRIFKQLAGITPKAYAMARRGERVREALARDGASVTDAIYGAGYGSGSRFYERSNRLLGMTPTRLRSGGADADIRFAIAQSSLGAILVAASGKGVCAIALGDDPDQLARDLQDRFPKAALVGDDPGFAAVVAQVVGLAEMPGRDAGGATALPLDIRGTAFQQRVWRALCDIPVGKTVSYTEVADRIGMPKAVRAVAGACAANTIALAVPCHRVVRTDGSLSGYRWGVERKRVLLDRERQGSDW